MSQKIVVVTLILLNIFIQSLPVPIQEIIAFFKQHVKIVTHKIYLHSILHKLLERV